MHHYCIIYLHTSLHPMYIIHLYYMYIIHLYYMYIIQKSMAECK